MNEKYLGDALLRGEDPIDLDALTRRVLRRDRRRMWILGILCVIAWMLVVMLPWGTTLPMLAKIAQQQGQVAGHAVTTNVSQQHQALSVEQILKKGITMTFLLSIGSMFAAAVCTVALILLSRRATLRQVNARLMEISSQLKSLAAAPK